MVTLNAFRKRIADACSVRVRTPGRRFPLPALRRFRRLLCDFVDRDFY